jgi:hypothetical protein
MRNSVFAVLILMAIATGCVANQKVPAAADIQKMVVVVRKSNHKDDKRVVVPTSHIPKIWATIQPAEVDKFPLKWKFMGYDLEITTKQGKKLKVWLFFRGNPPGAFAVGPVWKERTYFRGGDSQRLRMAIKAALKDASKK